jgi:catechol 2,3-dioxygenase-like lactoylglutathione lyase family enzyme
MVRGLAHLCFSVADLNRSIEFYCGKLGLRRAFDFVRDNGELYGVYLKAGPRVFIELFKGEVAPRDEHQSFKHICLEVDEIHTTVKDLRGKGIEVGEITLGLDHSYQAWLSDPDGNRIELHCYTADSWQAPHLS